MAADVIRRPSHEGCNCGWRIKWGRRERWFERRVGLRGDEQRDADHPPGRFLIVHFGGISSTMAVLPVPLDMRMNTGRGVVIIVAIAEMGVNERRR